jgi:hypothetical protein
VLSDTTESEYETFLLPAAIPKLQKVMQEIGKDLIIVWTTFEVMTLLSFLND